MGCFASGPHRHRGMHAVAVGAFAIAALSGCVSLPPAPAPSAESTPLDALVGLAAERLASAEGAAAAKWQTEARVDDPARTQEVLAGVRALAGQHDVAPEFAELVFIDQIQATESIQYARFAEWKLSPTEAPVERPKLTDVRADIDRITEAMIAELSGNRHALTSPDCTTVRDRALRSTVQNLELSDLYERALTRATQSYCVNAETP
ncbi:chorismate mutase [Agromyces silvae]|uniref:chorismate mutase n=1 Tax=Agromyces silvae TaxID=3388266 RepID=UPI00280ADE68|nr:chorismate mutase [Agromyces protaetiae]